MIAVPFKYEAHFFGDMADIKPSADTIPPLLDAFRVPGFLPNTFNELELRQPDAQALTRLRLSSPDAEWIIDFDTPRITIQKNSVKPLGANLGKPEDFARDAVDFLRRILHLFPRKGTRLSLVTDGLLSEMADEVLRRAYSRVLVPFGFYQNNPPIAWNSRSLARVSVDINGISEQLNVITQVNRTQGTFMKQGGLFFDRLQILFDINTHQNKREPRFDISAAEEYFGNALKIREQILRDLKEQLNG